MRDSKPKLIADIMVNHLLPLTKELGLSSPTELISVDDFSKICDMVWDESLHMNNVRKLILSVRKHRQQEQVYAVMDTRKLLFS